MTMRSAQSTSRRAAIARSGSMAAGSVTGIVMSGMLFFSLGGGGTIRPLGVDLAQQLRHASAVRDGLIQLEREFRRIANGQALRQLVTHEAGSVSQCLHGGLLLFRRPHHADKD